jgi:hypothetical protein
MVHSHAGTIELLLPQSYIEHSGIACRDVEYWKSGMSLSKVVPHLTHVIHRDTALPSFSIESVLSPHILTHLPLEPISAIERSIDKFHLGFNELSAEPTPNLLHSMGQIPSMLQHSRIHATAESALCSKHCAFGSTSLLPRYAV